MADDSLIGTTYRDEQGRRFQAICFAYDSETGERFVVLQDLSLSSWDTRPAASFAEAVGKSVFPVSSHAKLLSS